MENSPPIVFISYAHEDDLSSKVKSLADWLISNGVQVITDHPYVNRPPEQGWRTWMQHSVEDADMVLIVCTHRYKKLFERRTEKIDHGKALSSQPIFTNHASIILASSQYFLIRVAMKMFQLF